MKKRSQRKKDRMVWRVCGFVSAEELRKLGKDPDAEVIFLTEAEFKALFGKGRR